KTSIFSHPVYLFLREFSLQDFRGGSDHRRWFHSYQSHRSGQFSVRAVNCTLIHENTGFLDSDAQRCAFVCRYSEINQKIRRGRSLVQQPDQKPLTQQGLTV
ncbi:hypothetical protein C9218_19460, partial [Escherichia coli]